MGTLKVKHDMMLVLAFLVCASRARLNDHGSSLKSLLLAIYMQFLFNISIEEHISAAGDRCQHHCKQARKSDTL